MKLWSKQFFFRMLAKLDAESPLYLIKFLLRTSVCLVRSVSKNKGHIVCTHLCLNFSLLLFRNMLLHCLVLSTHVNLSDLQLLPGLPSDSVIGDSPPPANFQKSTPWDLTPWKKKLISRSLGSPGVWGIPSLWFCEIKTYIQEGISVELGHPVHKNTGTPKPRRKHTTNGSLDPASVWHVPHDIWGCQVQPIPTHRKATDQSKTKQTNVVLSCLLISPPPRLLK